MEQQDIPTNIIQLLSGNYKATFDSVEMTVPNSTGNKHYNLIQEAIANGAEVTIETSPPVSIFEVKAEAQHRIYNILPEWKQRNLTARAAELAIKGQANWTPEEQAEYDAGQLLWDQIKAIRAASDALELMNPIPDNYTDDSYWP
jgi:hypothetical protein